LAADVQGKKVRFQASFWLEPASRPISWSFPVESFAMKVLQACGWLALALMGASAAVCAAQNGNTPTTNPFRPLPPIPSPAPWSPDQTSPATDGALRAEERLESQLRKKQLTDATDLLLKVAQELRAEMAADPKGIPTETESERLKLIEKLAHLIQEREKAEYQAAAALAKTKGGP
jgi:hypothetical protein